MFIGHDKSRIFIIAPLGAKNGRGKTHTFRKLVESLPERSTIVIFTLINNLVDDLSELENIAEREVSGGKLVRRSNPCDLSITLATFEAANFILA